MEQVRAELIERNIRVQVLMITKLKGALQSVKIRAISDHWLAREIKRVEIISYEHIGYNFK